MIYHLPQIPQFIFLQMKQTLLSPIRMFQHFNKILMMN